MNKRPNKNASADSPPPRRSPNLDLRDKNVNTFPSEDEMSECLQRSGYLLEGRLIRNLYSMGLFVEPSQSILDTRTGISRELDMVAESSLYNPDREKVCVKSTFVIEAINNLFPVALLTVRPNSPNSNPNDYLRYKMTPSETTEPHPFGSKVDILEAKNVYKWTLYSQYCSFTRKKQSDELMACHGDDLHTSILKAVEYSMVASDQYHSWMDKKSDSYWRVFQWYPMIVLADHLYVLNEDTESGCPLVRTGHAILQYNFHFNNKPVTSAVHFVTEAALPQFVDTCLTIDDEIEERIFRLRPKTEKA